MNATGQGRRADHGGRWTFSCLAVVAVILLLVLWVVPSQRRTYSIDELRIQAAVFTDGTLNVSERFTYTFEGAYTRVYRDLPFVLGKPVKVTGVSGPDGPLLRLPSGGTPASGTPSEVDADDDAVPVSWTSVAPRERPAGCYRVTLDAGAPCGRVVRVEVFGDLRDRTAAYTVRWRANGAAERFADTGELHWQVVGSRWEVGIGRVRAVVKLPLGASAETTQAWTHGALDGVVRVRKDGSVALVVDGLAAHTPVETRLLFPATLLRDVRAEPSGVLPTRLDTEDQLARQATELRRLAELEVEASHHGLIGWTAGALVLLAAPAIWLVLFVRHRTAASAGERPSSSRTGARGGFGGGRGGWPGGGRRAGDG